MEPLPREASAADPTRPAIPSSESLPTAHYVAVVFKERRYDTDAHTTWCGAHMAEVAVVHGRLQRIREGYGVAFDGPSRSIDIIVNKPIDQKVVELSSS